MRYPVVSTFFAFILISTSVDAAPYVSNRVTQQQEKKQEIPMETLFVQQAQEAIIQRDENNQLLLVLHTLNPDIAFVTERPVRIAGKISLQQFMNTFHQYQLNSETNNPNSTLIVKSSASLNMPEKNSGIRLLLSNPSYDPHAQTLSYTIGAIDSRVAIKEGTHQNPILFIDNNCLWRCE